MGALVERTDDATSGNDHQSHNMLIVKIGIVICPHSNRYRFSIYRSVIHQKEPSLSFNLLYQGSMVARPEIDLLFILFPSVDQPPASAIHQPMVDGGKSVVILSLRI
jgi:hypothetical protein